MTSTLEASIRMGARNGGMRNICELLLNVVGRSRGAAEKAKVVYNSYLCPNQDTIIFKGVYHGKVRSRSVQQAL